MVKWSRVQLGFSVISAAGLWQTLRERVAISFKAKNICPLGSSDDTDRKLYDYTGAIHVHSTYSDGAGSVEEVAAAAVEAEVDFVLLTDHSSLDAISNGQAKWYGGKSLIIAGTEITTDLGHILALRVPPSMSVIPASTDTIVGDIAANGGFGIVALPCDLKDHWRDFSRFPSGYGLEVFNLSSIARTKINIPGLLLTFARYLSRNKYRAFHFIASRPNRELKLWDKMCITAHKSGQIIPKCIGSLDAHGVMKVARRKYNIPTYADVFKVLTTHVVLSKPLTHSEENADADIEQINAAIETGASYVCYDIYGNPSGFEFRVDSGGTNIMIGGSVPADRKTKKTAEVRVPTNMAIIRLIRNGKTIANVRGQKLSKLIRKPGVYRVEVSTYSWRLGPLCFGVHPWIFSNPIAITR